MFFEEIVKHLGFRPTIEQSDAITTFCRFMDSLAPNVSMILCGSAGTGKTTLAAAIVRALNAHHRKMCLLAPTGRAAKVFSSYSGKSASTIHRQIYRQKNVGELTPRFQLNYNRQSNTLFIVDEASMIGAELLSDLIRYIYHSATNCRLLLIGDFAQLPPVGEVESPALSTEVLSSFSLVLFRSTLSEVLRQAYNSGILYNATLVRNIVNYNTTTRLPIIQFKGFPDIRSVPGDELIEQLSQSYSSVGVDETMVITRSNRRANIFNNGIRNQVLFYEEELSQGDMLIVVKNNYYWSEYLHLPLSFIANGDRLLVCRVYNTQELFGFRFTDLLVEMPDYENVSPFRITAICNSLSSESPSLTEEESATLYANVLEDYLQIRSRVARIKAIRNDPHYNALQIKYAYAITCHKAQGGQWSHVYVDQGFLTAEMINSDYIHWLYTAFTRATDKLYLINWPKNQTSP